MSREAGGSRIICRGWLAICMQSPSTADTQQREGVRHRAQIGSEIIFNVSDKSHGTHSPRQDAWGFQQHGGKWQEQVEKANVLGSLQMKVALKMLGYRRQH